MTTDVISTSKSEVLSILDDRKLDILLTVGAGDIDTLVLPIKKKLLDK